MKIVKAKLLVTSPYKINRVFINNHDWIRYKQVVQIPLLRCRLTKGQNGGLTSIQIALVRSLNKLVNQHKTLAILSVSMSLTRNQMKHTMTKRNISKFSVSLPPPLWMGLAQSISLLRSFNNRLYQLYSPVSIWQHSSELGTFGETGLTHSWTRGVHSSRPSYITVNKFRLFC